MGGTLQRQRLPKETVVAEKFEAMVKLGIANTRMKDSYDLQVLARTLPFDGKTLSEAIRKTVRNRNTAPPASGKQTRPRD